MPVVLSDDFLLPFVGSAGGGGLLSLHVVDRFALRVAEDDIEQLPAILRAAEPHHPEMLRNLQETPPPRYGGMRLGQSWVSLGGVGWGQAWG